MLRAKYGLSVLPPKVESVANMVPLGSMCESVRPTKEYYVDNELIDMYYSKIKDDIHLEYVYLPTLVELCRNDNIKTHINHIFSADPFCWNITCQWFLDKRQLLFERCRVLSLDEALVVANKTTTSGYIPTKLKYLTKGDYYNDTQLLRQDLQDISDGRGRPVIWSQAPKSEIRPYEKLGDPDPSKRKQRTMNSSDALHYIVGVILFHDQNEKLLHSSSQSLDLTPKISFVNDWSAAGSSRYYGGWDKLATYLKKNSHKSSFYCNDISAMESCVTLEFMDVIYLARSCHLYDSSGNPRLFQNNEYNYINLFEWWVRQVKFSIVLDIDGDLWMQYGQNPSGGNNTLYDNIDTVILSHAYHLCKTTKTLDPDELDDYFQKTRMKIMGDDTIILHDSLDTPYGPVLIWDGLFDTLYECAIVAKPEIDGRVPLEQAVFCGASWQYSVSLASYIPKINIKKCLANLLFHRKKNSYRFAFAKLCALKVLAFGHDPYYEIISSFIDYYKAKHMTDMENEKQFDSELPLHSVLKQEKSNMQIRALYLH